MAKLLCFQQLGSLAAWRHKELRQPERPSRSELTIQRSSAQENNMKSEALAKVISEQVKADSFREQNGARILTATNGQKYSTTGNQNMTVDGEDEHGKFQDRITVCVNRWYSKPEQAGRINTQVLRQASKNPDKLSPEDKAKAIEAAQALLAKLQ